MNGERDREIVRQLKTLLLTDKDSIDIRLTNSSFSRDFLRECISEIELIPVNSLMGVRPSSLEIFALHILADAASVLKKE